MTSLTESFNAFQYTLLYQNEQNEREILQWRLLEKVMEISISQIKLVQSLF